MANFIYAMNQSLDGYVDHTEFRPEPALFRHFIDRISGVAGVVYGRVIYEVMRYWEEDLPGWDDGDREFAQAWRRAPKWVVSRTLHAVGPNATLVAGDVEATMRRLKAGHDGEIDVAGPNLAQTLTDLGLIDEYRLYFHPVVLGHGKPYFAGPRPMLRLLASEVLGEGTARLTYVPA